MQASDGLEVGGEFAGREPVNRAIGSEEAVPAAFEAMRGER